MRTNDRSHRSLVLARRGSRSTRGSADRTAQRGRVTAGRAIGHRRLSPGSENRHSHCAFSIRHVPPPHVLGLRPSLPLPLIDPCSSSTAPVLLSGQSVQPLAARLQTASRRCPSRTARGDRPTRPAVVIYKIERTIFTLPCMCSIHSRKPGTDVCPLRP